MRTLIFYIFISLGQVAYPVIDDEAKEALNRYMAVTLWKSGNAAYTAGDSLIAEQHFVRAMEYARSDPGFYMALGRSRFDRGDFAGSVDSLDLYMELVSEAPIALLLRGLAKQRTMPEDIQGACADFHNLESSGFDISVIADIDIYCGLQPGWNGR